MNNTKISTIKWTILSGLLTLLPVSGFAQTSTPVPPVANPCPRFTAGSVTTNPPALYSQNGVLNVQFSYQTTTDSVGRQLFCFMTPDGLENPTLHVNPGDTLNITVTNNTPFTEVGDPDTDELFSAPNCGDTTFEKQNPVTNSQGFTMTAGSMNIHYHGTNTSPHCGGDNVVKTLINPTHTFQYNVPFPTNEPPGLYWYHPHVHGLAEAAVFGGAAAALVVDGIQNVQPKVAGMKERFIVIRDQPTIQNLAQSPSNTDSPLGIPQHDLTVNFVPLDTFTNTNAKPKPTTTYTPAVIYMQAGEQQFWRVCNCTSDAPLDLQVRFDGVAQTIQLVGIDAVPVNSQNGTQPGQLIPVTHFRIPPASRVEFIVNAPSSSVKLAQLVTQLINSGPLGDDLPTRPLLTMQVVSDDTETVDNSLPASTTGMLAAQQPLFGGIQSVTPAVTRTLFFEEVEDGSAFFVNFSGCVTASGAQCATQPYPIDTIFDNNRAPAFITTQGTVEKWIFQNHARENHELHQHQTHFLVLSQDNFEANGSQQAPGINGQFLDMIEIPFCGGPPPAHKSVQPPACVDSSGNPVIPYPQVQLLVDFRGPDVGAFVFHCHILGHEDLGMMAIEQVVGQQ